MTSVTTTTITTTTTGTRPVRWVLRGKVPFAHPRPALRCGPATTSRGSGTGWRGFRRWFLFVPKSKGGVAALWKSNTSQPGGLEFEVMDMLYGLPFRDWMEIDKSGGPAAEPEEVASTGSGESR